MINVYNNIVKDIKELKGATVKVFGQPTKLSDDIDNYTIDILDVLDSLSDNVIDLYDYFSDDDDLIYNTDDYDASDIINKLYEYGYIYSNISDKCDNSYNWSSPISNHFNYYIYKSALDNGVFVEFKVHRFGDVRGNYTDSMILYFNNEYEFFEKMSENNTYQTITVNDVDYNIEVSIFSDTYEVYNMDGFYICSAYGEENDIINCIKENVTN